MNRTICYWLCLGLLLCLLVVPLLARADGLDAILRTNTLVVGVEEATPPFSFIDPKTHARVGYDIDLARAIAQHLGVDVELQAMSSHERIHRLLLGEVDMVVASLSITDERAAQVDFSRPYFVTTQQLLTRKGKVHQLADLVHAQVAVVRGTTGEQFIMNALPQATVRAFDSAPQALATMQQDSHIMAMSEDTPILNWALAHLSDAHALDILPLMLAQERYGIAVKHGETRLLQKINHILLELDRSGDSTQRAEKWLSMPPH